jgi:prepilin-type N-terminal cleavage/methylation domain-containing protein/prepilin-type processing-associated H-X9-DG protein
MKPTIYTMNGVVKRRAFTLIELVTVVAVIAILISLVLPALSRVRERARCARCVANLKQLHAAAMNFAMENNALFPYAATYETFNPVSMAWVKDGTGWLDWYTDRSTYSWGTAGRICIQNGTLFSYVGDTRVYLCPTFAMFKISGRTDFVRSYGMCDKVSGANTYAIVNPSRLLMFSEQSNRLDTGLEFDRFVADGDESYWYLATAGWAYFSKPPDRVYAGATTYGSRRVNISYDGVLDVYSQCTGWSGPPRVLEHLGAYHDGYANCIFVDGHVERVWAANSNGIAVCSGSWERVN